MAYDLGMRAHKVKNSGQKAPCWKATAILSGRNNHYLVVYCRTKFTNGYKVAIQTRVCCYWLNDRKARTAGY